MENSKEHGLDGIAWPGARANQFIKVTTSRGMHDRLTFFRYADLISAVASKRRLILVMVWDRTARQVAHTRRRSC